MIFGDYGYFDAETEFAPFQHFVSLTSCSGSASGDTLFGGEGDDILIGGEVRVLTSASHRVVVTNDVFSHLASCCRAMT